MFIGTQIMYPHLLVSTGSFIRGAMCAWSGPHEYVSTSRSQNCAGRPASSDARAAGAPPAARRSRGLSAKRDAVECEHTDRRQEERDALAPDVVVREAVHDCRARVCGKRQQGVEGRHEV